MLGDDPRIGSQKPRAGPAETLQGGVQKIALRIGRIHEHNVERWPARRIAGEPAQHIAPDDRHAWSSQSCSAQVLGNDACCPSVLLDEHRALRTARQRLDAGRAAPREQVEHDGSRQLWLENGEECLLDPVCQRSRAGPGRQEPDSARRTGDHAAGLGHVRRYAAPEAGSPAATRASQPVSSSSRRG